MARYTTTEGDDLRKLARDAGMSVQQLLKLNPTLERDGELAPGTEIRLGAGRSIDGERSAPGVDRATREEIEAMTPRELRLYREGREQRQSFQERKRQRTLMQDTSYATFMRNMGFSESEIESNLTALKDNHLRQLQQQAPLFEDQRIQAEARVNQDFESSGLFRSGERLNEVGRERSEVDSSEAQFRFGLDEERTAAEAEAARKIAALRRQQAEEALAATERLTMAEAERNLV